MTEKRNGKIWNISIIAGLLLNVIFIVGVYGDAKGKRVLTDDQVERNKANYIELKSEFENAKIELIDYRLEQIEKKVDAIYEMLME